ncbi:MAG: LPXTG cell wall anchor domain-containing protein [Clostridia bacterium]|nr:LPXTG cell wall anchor domain-containing protein [Clostridia bacterium]
MKRAFAFMMALALVLSLSVNVFAAETGSITIANPTFGVEYAIYKIFDATYKPAVEETGKKGVAYSIDPGTALDPNPVFDLMFEYDEETKTYTNDIFNYNPDSNAVTLKDGIGDDVLFAYLQELVENDSVQPVLPTVTLQPESEEEGEMAEPIVFENLPYGYYLITSSLGALVTVNSNTPDITVVDKNQEPNDVDDLFEKKVQAGVDTEGKPNWVESNSALVGDDVTYKVSFGATNYDGDDLIKYYVIRDEKSSSLWVEFQDIAITVTDKKTGEVHTLDKGFYYCANDAIDTDEWEYIGAGWGTITEGQEPDPNTADWYLIHYTYDAFEIVIPWLDDYTFTGKQNATQGFKLDFDLRKDDNNEVYSESMYGSPAHVEIIYTAAVGPDAVNSNAENKAWLDWVTTDGTYGPEDPEITVTKTYNMAIIKTANDGDAATQKPATRLAGATFEIYQDADCTIPVYVIPTNNPGVYILDDFANDTSGQNRVTSRERYAGYWEDYINGTVDAPNPNGSENPRNDITTLEDGQLIILGLEAGTYYIKETNPPVGYNPLPGVTTITVGPEGGAKTESFPGYVSLPDADGNRQDLPAIVAHTITIINYQGSELPSTGGAGTVKMITIGTIVAIGFAVLLITQKKMTVYQD